MTEKVKPFTFSQQSNRCFSYFDLLLLLLLFHCRAAALHLITKEKCSKCANLGLWTTFQQWWNSLTEERHTHTHTHAHTHTHTHTQNHNPPTLSGKAITLLFFLQRKGGEPRIECERKASLTGAHRWYHRAGVCRDRWRMWNKKPADRRPAMLDDK